jgi:hypothetical protein
MIGSESDQLTEHPQARTPEIKRDQIDRQESISPLELTGGHYGRADLGAPQTHPAFSADRSLWPGKEPLEYRFSIRMLDWLACWDSYLPHGFNSLPTIMGLQLHLAFHIRRLYHISLNA